MLHLVEKTVWCGLIALGSQFSYIGVRVRFDRSYSYFGLSLLLLAAGQASGAWSQGPAPGYSPHETRLSLGMFLLQGPLLLLFFSHFTQEFRPRAFRVVLGLSLLAVLFLVGNPLAYLPFLLAQAMIGWSLAARLRKGPAADRRQLAWVAAGWAIWMAGMLAGGLGMSTAFPGPTLPSWGAGVFAVAATAVLMNRFLSLHLENRAIVEQLALAYAGLQAAAKLRDLGSSAAVISHEIKNYVSTMKGNALLLQRKLDAGVYREEADRIGYAADRIDSISRDIAAYAGAEPLPESVPLGLDEVAAACVRQHFPGTAMRFRIAAWPRGAKVAGDAGRLEQVFLNLFKNALEAGADGVDVRFRTWGDRLVVAVEDDGKGCRPEELDRIAVPFYSGKPQGLGNGLGCSIAAAILKHHRATFRAYAKNALGSGPTGLILNMVFPLEAGGRDARADVVVASDHAETRSCILSPLLNLGIHPGLCSEGEAEEAAGRGASGRLVFLGSESAERCLRSGLLKAAMVADPRRVAQWMRKEAGAVSRPFLLSEENLIGVLGEVA